MTIRATSFTPEVLLGAPRRSAGAPNTDGTQALYSLSTYNFEKHEKRSEIRLLDLNSNESELVLESSDAQNPKWLNDNNIVLFISEKGQTHVVIGNPREFEKTRYTAGTIDAAVGDLRIKSTAQDTFILAFSAPTKPDGTLYNAEKQEKSFTTGRLYNATFVRHWDSWATEIKSSVWITTLSKQAGEKAAFSLGKLKNAVDNNSLESPIQPFGGLDNFDISTQHLAFVSKDPQENPAYNTKQNIYLIDLSKASEQIVKSIKPLEIPGFEGATSNPVFSPNGKQLAFTSMRENGYESDKNQLFVYHIDSKLLDALYSTNNGKGSWDRSPSSISWSVDGDELYVTAEEHGRNKLFSIDLANVTLNDSPVNIFSHGGVSDITVLPTGIFLSTTSLIDNSAYHFIPNKKSTAILLSSNSHNGAKFGLSRNQISEIRFPGAQKGTTVQAWVIKPSNFDDSKKYPLAYLIHGGPQGAWGDSWSTRWNPAIFAEQGYVVVTPNPTGSTGFGQEFTDAIKEQWGGLPYLDIVNGFNYIEENLKYVDTGKAVALGASYGGYMMNWIQGNDLGRRFKALVTHDGVFSMTGQLASEEIYFPNREFGGIFWENREKWSQWDPANHAQNWNTPHLIIHSNKDYRLTISEGLAAFNVLQQKGVESQFLTFPDENHWVLKPENSLLWHTVVLDFINTKVGLKTYSEQSQAAKELKMVAFFG